MFVAVLDEQPDLSGLTPAARRVLATAAALFYERGAADTSVRDLTRACGLSPGALYNHFPSKDELLFTLVRHGHVRMRSRIDQALADCPDEPRARFAAFVHAYVLGHLSLPELAQVVRREYLHLAPEHRAVVIRDRRRIRRVLESILDAGVRAGCFDLVGGADALTGQAVMVLDMCSRTSEWFDPRGSSDAAELAARYVLAAQRMIGLPG